MKTEKPLRVLHVITGMGSGGAESLIMNLYRHMDHELIQFDFLLRSNENIYTDELNRSGCKVYVCSSFPRHALKNRREVRDFFRDHTYDIIHVHANALIYMTALEEARKNNVKCRIMHSHSTATKYRFLRAIHAVNKKRISSLATHFLACSEEAGRWMFPDDYIILKNGIDLEKYYYSENDRKRIRAELNLPEDSFVIGHIGRFLPVKNHPFILEVFSDILKYRPNSYLVLVGTGDLLDSVKRRVQEANLESRVLFLGVRTDIPSILSALDVFLFPSIYEGLPVVAVEAQANGLPIFCSDSISDSALITSCVHKLSLSKAASDWAHEILFCNAKRQNTIETLRNAGFDISTSAEKLQSFYLTAVEKE